MVNLRRLVLLIPAVAVTGWMLHFQANIGSAMNNRRTPGPAQADTTKVLGNREEKDSNAAGGVPAPVVAKEEIVDRNTIRQINEAERTIFVSVAAFRDSETRGTLSSLFKKAKHPERVFVGLVCQRDMSRKDEECIPEEWSSSPTAGWRKNIRELDVDALKASGPTYARYQASLLHKDEDYFMMIDSHNKFVSNWDEKIISMHSKCDSPKCVLSVYPMGTDDKEHEKYDNRPHVAYLCSNSAWHESGYPGPFAGAVFDKSTEPRPQPYIGAGLVFGSKSILAEVPFDPHLPFLFHGEEILITVRLWTHGYDLFSPGENILFHHYYRPGKPRMESLPAWHVHNVESSRRVAYLLQLPSKKDPTKLAVPKEKAKPAITIEEEKYGLGTKRTVEQYWEFARIDIRKRNHKRANAYWCDKYKGQPPYSKEWKKAAGYTE